MNQELSDKIVKEFPEIFTVPNYRALALFHIECGDGWHNIVYSLCQQIRSRYREINEKAHMMQEMEDLIDNGLVDKVPPYMLSHIEQIKNGNMEHPVEVDYPIVHQVKEKFGDLRFYMSGGDDITQGMINLAESLSARTCEECGSPGKTRRGAWVHTLCDNHAKS